jgi:uncharacterized protein
MGRLIFIAVVVVALVWLLRRALAGPPSGDGGARQPPGADTAQGELVGCAHCAVNLPRSEARSSDGRFYCSEEHWRLGPRER